MLRKKTAAYALLAMYEIAQQGAAVSNPPGLRAGDIAERYRVPRAYMAKILSQLAGAGVLHSDRGPHGGFRLNRPADRTTLYEVLMGVGALLAAGPSDLIRNLPPPVESVLSRCGQEETAAMKNLFERTTIADMIR